MQKTNCISNLIFWKQNNTAYIFEEKNGGQQKIFFHSVKLKLLQPLPLERRKVNTEEILIRDDIAKEKIVWTKREQRDGTCTNITSCTKSDSLSFELFSRIHLRRIESVAIIQ